jgi:phosphoribosylformylglycinamidine cyclo-ligase
LKEDKLSYKDAGVDIDAGNQFVENIKPFVKSTFDKNVIGGIGSFAGAYELPAGFKEPVMLAATDGVGTKLKLAIEAGKFDTVGIDLVAMCVNDLICNFGTPSFFLDYYATAELKTEEASDVVKGIAQGCVEAECALIGGETAEMPGMYAKGDFDLAGFAVGVAEKSEMNRVKLVKEGDILIALPSSGIHSNGFSLARKIFFEKLNLDLNSDFEGKKLIDVLLEPTRIYVKTFKKLKDKIKALAHITGGGLIENTPRMFSKDLNAYIEKEKIKVLPIFDFMASHVEESEMFRTFNMGVGMVLAVSPENVDEVLENSDGYIIGYMKKGNGETELV